MRDIAQSPRMLGYVQVQVGSRVFALPVQAVRFEEPTRGKPVGGFFEEGAGGYGILVDEGASEADLHAQIARGSAEAVQHLSRKLLN